MGNKIKKNQGGFTIVEVLIALFVTGLMLLLYSASANSVTLNRNSKHEDLAHRIAVSEMEDIRSLAFANIPATGPFTDPLFSQLPSAQGQLTITPVNPDVKIVNVTVTWTEPGNPAIHSVNLETLISSHGL